MVAQADDAAELRRRQAELATRLDNGLEKIQRARLRGQDVAPWETLWCDLLGQYEQVFDRLQGEVAG